MDGYWIERDTETEKDREMDGHTVTDGQESSQRASVFISIRLYVYSVQCTPRKGMWRAPWE